MITIIAGSRNITNYDLVKAEIDKFHAIHIITQVVSGCARGVDTLGELWAYENNVEVVRMPAQWALHGRRAGPARNIRMAHYASDTGGLIIVRHADSVGSMHMASLAADYNLILQETIV